MYAFTNDTSAVFLDVLREMNAARKRRAGDNARLFGCGGFFMAGRATLRNVVNEYK